MQQTNWSYWRNQSEMDKTKVLQWDGSSFTKKQNKQKNLTNKRKTSYMSWQTTIISAWAIVAVECPYRVRDAKALGKQVNPNLVNADLPHTQNIPTLDQWLARPHPNTTAKAFDIRYSNIRYKVRSRWCSSRGRDWGGLMQFGIKLKIKQTNKKIIKSGRLTSF